MSELGKKVLSALLIVGAQSREMSESAAHLASRLELQAGSLEKDLRDLQAKGYVTLFEKDGTLMVYLTTIGIVTASSTYS